MATAALIIALISSSAVAAQNWVAVVASIKATHQHTTGVVYRKVLKPTGKGVAHGAKKVILH